MDSCTSCHAIDSKLEFQSKMRQQYIKIKEWK